MNSYINGTACISIQPTFLTHFFQEEQSIAALKVSPEEVYYAQEPSYKEYIAPNASRRMAKGVKMGIATATEALKEANITTPDAILVGTGMGCVQDSEKFLTALLQNNEQHLTPTSFIQSTHNTVAGQIALNLQCKGLNFTYVNGAVSFESALLDAKIQMEQGTIATALVGGVDEHSPHTVFLHNLVGLNQKGEGASFFALSSVPTSSTYAQLVDITLRNELTPDEFSPFLTNFLNRNNITLDDITLIFTGEDQQRNITTPTIHYKPLCAEYYTASAFGLCYASHYIKHTQAKYVLLINSYRNKDFSLALLASL